MIKAKLETDEAMVLQVTLIYQDPETGEELILLHKGPLRFLNADADPVDTEFFIPTGKEIEGESE